MQLNMKYTTRAYFHQGNFDYSHFEIQFMVKYDKFNPFCHSCLESQLVLHCGSHCCGLLNPGDSNRAQSQTVI